MRFDDGSVATISYVTKGTPATRRRYSTSPRRGRSARSDNFRQTSLWSGQTPVRAPGPRGRRQGPGGQIGAFLRSVRTGGAHADRLGLAARHDQRHLGGHAQRHRAADPRRCEPRTARSGTAAPARHVCAGDGLACARQAPGTGHGPDARCAPGSRLATAGRRAGPGFVTVLPAGTAQADSRRRSALALVEAADRLVQGRVRSWGSSGPTLPTGLVLRSRHGPARPAGQLRVPDRSPLRSRDRERQADCGSCRDCNTSRCCRRPGT